MSEKNYFGYTSKEWFRGTIYAIVAIVVLELMGFHVLELIFGLWSAKEQVR